MELDMAVNTRDLADLDKDIEKVEFKVTVVGEDEPKVLALIGQTDGKEREVYFYDTKRLALKSRALFLRARLTEGEADSTVKLRPAHVENDNAAWRKIDKDERRVELDVVGVKQIDSVKVDRTLKPGDLVGGGTVKSLFSDRQETLIEAYADGIALEVLEVLGPVDARVWDKLRLAGLTHDVSIEEWALPNDTHFYELSFKVKRNEASDAHAAFEDALARLEIKVAAEQVAKTEQVLEFFADRLP
jgi:uncharacterized protein YjbK